MESEPDRCLERFAKPIVRSDPTDWDQDLRFPPLTKGFIMKVTKTGKLPEDQIYKGTCGHCGTEVEYKKSEERSGDSTDQRDAGIRYVICPLCKGSIYGKKKIESVNW